MQSPGERIEHSQLVKVKRVYLPTDICEISFKITAVKLNNSTEILLVLLRHEILMNETV